LPEELPTPNVSIDHKQAEEGSIEEEAVFQGKKDGIRPSVGNWDSTDYLPKPAHKDCRETLSHALVSNSNFKD
jgi:hypothetical protein